MYLCTWACHHSSVPLLWLAGQLLNEAQAYQRHPPMAGFPELPKTIRESNFNKDREISHRRNLCGPDKPLVTFSGLACLARP